jgi:hypothetical protein
VGAFAHKGFLVFLRGRQFHLQLGGEIGCGTNCRDFEVIAGNGSRFFSPPLSAFAGFSLGPDPNLDNHIAIKLRRRWEVKLAEAGTEPTLEEIQAVAEAFIESQKPSRRKSYVQ